MATDHNFRIKNGLEVGGQLIVNSAGALVVSSVQSQLQFNDNVKAKFGNGSDLQVYHDGSHSYVTDTGTGNLWLGGSVVNIGTPNASAYYISATQGGAVQLYHNGNVKIATTSTGIDVTGRIDLDSSATQLSAASDDNLRIQTADGYTEIGAANSGWSHFRTDRARFFFDKGITVDSGLIGSYNEDLQLQHSGVTKVTVTSTSLDITGDLNVTGDINTVSSTNLDITDKVITAGVGGTSSTNDGGGFKLAGANAEFVWDNANTRMTLNKDLNLDGNLRFGTSTFSASGDNTHVHFSSTSALIPHTTTTANNPKLGTSSYRWFGVYGGVADFSGGGSFGGNVAVNKVSPKLSLVATDAGQASVDLSNTALAARWILDSDDLLRVYNQTSAFDAFAVKSSGKVGIGTASPTSLLHIDDAITGDASQLTITNGAGATLRFGITGSGANENAHIKTHSGEDLEFHMGQGSNSTTPVAIFKSGGSVGIGTASPQAELHIKKQSAGTTHIDQYVSAIIEDTEARLQIISDDGGNNASSILLSNETKHWGILHKGPSSSNRFSIGYTATTSGGTDTVDSLTPMLNITTAGNVGIGTTTPGNKLDVSGVAMFTGGARLGSTTSGEGIYRQMGPTANGVAITTGSFASSGIKLFVAHQNDGGGVGIGTTAPEAQLHIKAASGTTGVIKIEGGKNTVTSAGEINAQLDFGSNDTSVNGTGNVGGRIASITRNTNGAHVDMAFSTFQQSASPDLAEHMRIRYDGNVGIGTADPGSKLDIKGNFESEYAIRFINTQGTGKTGGFRSHGTNGEDITLYQDGARKQSWNVADTMFYGAGNAQTVIIKNNGYVGISTTTPDSILHVVSQEIGTGANKGIKLSNYNETKHYSIRTGSTGLNNTAFAIYDESDSQNRLVIDTSGNVGIGTAAPGQKLHVNNGNIRVEKNATGLGSFISVGNTNEGTGNTSAYFFGNTASDTTYMKGGIIYETLATTNGRGDMHFVQNSVASSANATVSDSAMTILNSGSVGIGTTAPGAKLHIHQTGNGSTNSLVVEDDARKIEIGRDQIQVKNLTNSAENLYIQPGGNTSFGSTSGSVAIGIVSPTEKLHVASGSILVTPISYASNQDAYIIKAGAYNNANFDGFGLKMKSTSGGTPYMSLVDIGGAEVLNLKSGKIGIGTENPTEKLHVAGNALISGSVSASNVSVTNIVTNKVVKFNGSVLDDSNITDTGSLITLGSTTEVIGNLLLTGTATTSNQARTIDFTGFDKEGTTDPSDRAYIQHTSGTAGHAGSVLVISSMNDSGDGIGFLTHASSNLKHNSNTIWTAGNDGSGSGLDADTLDGQHGSYYQPAGSYLTAETNLFIGDGGSASTHPGTSRGIYTGQLTSGTAVLGLPTTDNSNSVLTFNRHSGEYNSQIGFSSNGNMYYRSFSNVAINSTSTWLKVWNAGNDGASSGLDADTVDGIQGSSIVKTTGNQTIDGVKVFTGTNVTLDNPVNQWKYLSLQSSGATKWDIATREDDTSGALQFRPLGGGGNTAYVTTGGYYVSDNQGTLWGSSNDGTGSGLDADLLDGIQGSSFLRSDAADISNNEITFNGGIKVLSGTGGGGLRIKRNSGSNTGDDVVDIHMDDSAMYVDIDNDSDGDTGLFIFRKRAGGAWVTPELRANTHEIWHAGNDGTGSGLDADLLDGQHGSYYANTATPSAPSITATSVVGETIEVTFTQSSTSGVDHYEVWSDGATGSDYSMIARIPEEDIASTMSIVDASFNSGGTVAYRAYAIHNGVYSAAGTATRAFTVPTNLDVAALSVIGDINVYHINYNNPTSRFLDHIEIYKDIEVSQGSLSRTGAALIYSGTNTAFTYNIGASDLDKYHQFWVEVVTV